MTLEAIKEAIAELPDVERISLISWLDMQNPQAWDRQIEADFSEGGAGMVLLQHWNAEIQSGQSIFLEVVVDRFPRGSCGGVRNTLLWR